jgi:excisionase family DNA binding protein
VKPLTPEGPAPRDELAELLTLDEVVTWLRVPRSWVYERTRKGQIPHVKLGKYLRFPRQALAEWLGAQNREGPSSAGSPLEGIGLTLAGRPTEGRAKDTRLFHHETCRSGRWRSCGQQKQAADTRVRSTPVRVSLEGSLEKQRGVSRACRLTPRQAWLRGLDLNQRPLGYEPKAQPPNKE